MIKVKAYYEKRNQYDNDFIEYIFKDIKAMKKNFACEQYRKIIKIEAFENNTLILIGKEKNEQEKKSKYFNTIKWLVA